MLWPDRYLTDMVYPLTAQYSTLDAVPEFQGFQIEKEGIETMISLITKQTLSERGTIKSLTTLD